MQHKSYLRTVQNDASSIINAGRDLNDIDHHFSTTPSSLIKRTNIKLRKQKPKFSATIDFRTFGKNVRNSELLQNKKFELDKLKLEMDRFSKVRGEIKRQQLFL
jgi:hypothetical protein